MKKPNRIIIVEIRAENIDRRKVEHLPKGWVKTTKYEHVSVGEVETDWTTVKPKKKPARKKK